MRVDFPALGAPMIATDAWRGPSARALGMEKNRRMIASVVGEGGVVDGNGKGREGKGRER